MVQIVTLFLQSSSLVSAVLVIFFFTTVLGPLLLHSRAKAHGVIMYLDDGWVCDSKQNCILMSENMQQDLLHADFLDNEEKSIWNPAQKRE